MYRWNEIQHLHCTLNSRVTRYQRALLANRIKRRRSGPRKSPNFICHAHWELASSILFSYVIFVKLRDSVLNKYCEKIALDALIFETNSKLLWLSLHVKMKILWLRFLFFFCSVCVCVCVCVRMKGQFFARDKNFIGFCHFPIRNSLVTTWSLQLVFLYYFR